MVLPSSRQGAFLMPTARAWSLSLLLGCALALPGVADDFHPHKYDWPQWQGPQRTAISQEKGLLKNWPKAESTLVDGDKLLVTPGGKKNSIAALDKKTGSLLWSSKVPQGDRAGYASLIAADVHGQRQYIQFMHGGVVGVAAKDGTFLWRYDE